MRLPAPASHTAPALPAIETKDDEDLDSDNYRYELPDNESAAFGHRAGAADARAAATEVRRYYAAAARRDGAAACPLLYVSLAQSVPDEYHDVSGAKGPLPCATVMSSMFTRTYSRVRGGTSARIKEVRVDFNQATVQFSLGAGGPDRYIMLHRQRGVWKIDMLLADDRPVGVE